MLHYTPIKHKSQHKNMITTLRIEELVNNQTHQDLINRINKVREYELEINVLQGFDIPTKNIIEFVQSHETAKCIRTIALDNAQSSGGYLFLLGQKRICHHRTQFLLHRHFDKETKKISPNLSDIELFHVIYFCKRTGMSLEKALKLMNENNGKGRVLKAYEAKQIGMVHEIW
jgi:ATP-dependent protease ClpP protease subunit